MVGVGLTGIGFCLIGAACLEYVVVGLRRLKHLRQEAAFNSHYQDYGLRRIAYEFCQEHNRPDLAQHFLR